MGSKSVGFELHISFRTACLKLPIRGLITRRTYQKMTLEKCQCKFCNQLKICKDWLLYRQQYTISYFETFPTTIVWKWKLMGCVDLDCYGPISSIFIYISLNLYWISSWTTDKIRSANLFVQDLPMLSDTTHCPSFYFLIDLLSAKELEWPYIQWTATIAITLSNECSFISKIC